MEFNMANKSGRLGKKIASADSSAYGFNKRVTFVVDCSIWLPPCRASSRRRRPSLSLSFVFLVGT